MAKISFIHLSDIHFTKDSNEAFDPDIDLRDALLNDIKNNAVQALEGIAGVLVSGDIAFSGQKEEYELAEQFLNELTTILRIDTTCVYCVPGNHDVNQDTIKNSATIEMLHSNIETKKTLDEATRLLKKFMQDKSFPGGILKPFDNYNNFANKYSCAVSKEETFWEKDFDLGYSVKLRICGINSCIISNSNDYRNGEQRYMFVAESQIPSYNEDSITMILSHHPIDLWMFNDELQAKLDKRAEVQLYGHKHEQAIRKSDENLVLTAGATQPTRGDDWVPRYNWITIECKENNKHREICIKIFPRKLTTDRNRFAVDKKSCDEDNSYFIYCLNIDEKHQRNMRDSYFFSNIADDRMEELPEHYNTVINEFLGFSYVKRQAILDKLHVELEDKVMQNHVKFMKEIIRAISENGQMDSFCEEVRNAI